MTPPVTSIKTEKTNDFSDIDADKLTPWRVSIPVVAVAEHKPFSLSEVDSATEFDSRDYISDVFEEKPLKKTIHIR
ncbi:hypothetical protein BG006_009762, partial [Podila minutissima]